MKRKLLTICLIFLCWITVFGQKISIKSPNNKVIITLFNLKNKTGQEWALKVEYNQNGNISEVIPKISLGSLVAIKTLFQT